MKFLVAVDESEGSLHALKWVLDHLVRLAVVGDSGTAGQPAGSLFLLHVQQPVTFLIPPVGPAAGVYPPILVTDSVKKAQEENSARLLSRAMEICKEREVEAETIAVEGDVKEMICEAADKIQPDILVVGSRGLSKWKRTFLGSVSDYCAHHASCPVLIVKPPLKAPKTPTTSAETK